MSNSEDPFLSPIIRFGDLYAVEPAAMSDEQIARRDAMSKHTPGPWVWSQRRDCSDFMVSAAKGSRFITQVRVGPEWEEAQNRANAALIASAPDLLASVERLEREREELLQSCEAAIRQFYLYGMHEKSDDSFVARELILSSIRKARSMPDLTVSQIVKEVLARNDSDEFIERAEKLLAGG